MKTLTLLRHAKSGWDDPELRDFDRPLNAKGQQVALAVGRNLKSMATKFDYVVASPAVRVVETLAQFRQGYGGSLAPAWDRRLYLASPASLLDVIHELPETASQALLIGHNPGLEELVLLLVPHGDNDPLREHVETKFPTASIAVLSFNIDHWVDVAQGGATLTQFIRPRDLDPRFGPDD